MLRFITPINKWLTLQRTLRPELPEIALEIIRVALAKNEADRYANPLAFAQALERLID